MGGAPASAKQIKKQQQLVIKKIVDMGPPDTWSKEQIDEMWVDVVLFGTKEERLPPQLRACTDPRDRVHVVCQCPYVDEFLKQNKWDVKSRLLAVLAANTGVEIPDEVAEGVAKGDAKIEITEETKAAEQQ